VWLLKAEFHFTRNERSYPTIFGAEQRAKQEFQFCLQGAERFVYISTFLIFATANILSLPSSPQGPAPSLFIGLTTLRFRTSRTKSDDQRG